MESQREADTADAGSRRRMSAIVQHGYGGTEVWRPAELPQPRPGPGEVLIAVRAAGIDRGTWHIMAGKPYLVRAVFGMRTPRRAVPGLDVAGEVAELGPGVTRFQVGDPVFGIAQGSFAEYAVALESKLALKPQALGFAEAGVLAVSGLTAHQAVHEYGRVAPGQRVLVTGASGGVGSYAVQLAAAAGADVTGVASAGKADFVRSLGASRVLDYRSTDVTELAERFDVIIDINGRKPVRRLQRILATDGTLVAVGGEDGGPVTGGFGRQLGLPLRSPFTRQRLVSLISRENRAGLEALAASVDAGVLRPAVTARYRLVDAADAMTDLVAGRIAGKAAIEVGAEGA